MEKKTEIAKQSIGSIQTAQPSLTVSQKSLARELDLTAANSKCALTEVLTDELFRLYSQRTPEAIEWVFRTHRDRSSFWPSISELNALFGEFYRLADDEKTQVYLRSLRRTREQLKAEGLPYGEAQFNELKRQLLNVVKSMDDAAKTPHITTAKNRAKAEVKRRKAAK
jgi:hypothetical protein